MRRSFLTSFAVLALVSLVGCSLATPTPTPPAVALDPTYTAAAQTIIAQLTQVASQGTPAPQIPPTLAPGTPIDSQEPAPLPASPTLQPSTTTTGTATPEPTASATPEPTATLAEGDPRLALGPPDFQDQFENSDNWPVYDDEHVEMRLEDNRLEMTALNADKWDSWMLTWDELVDFYLEADASTGECRGLDRWGLIFRAPEANQGYLFGFSCDGQYSLRRWNGARYLTLVDWTATDAIQSGSNAANRIAVQAQGRTLRLYANGQLLQELQDSSYANGGVGVFLGAVETQNFTVTFKQVSYWELP